MKDLVGLVELARELGTTRKALLGKLRALDREVHGMLLVRTAHKIYVNRTGLDAYRQMSRDAVFERLAQVEVTISNHEERLQNLEANQVSRSYDEVMPDSAQ